MNVVASGLDNILHCFLRLQAGAGWEVEWLGLEPVAIYDASTIGGGLS